MHKLLARLVKRHIDKQYDQSQIDNFLQALTIAFEQHDQDRSMLERSLMLTSDELNDINSELRSHIDKLEDSKTQLEETLVEQNAILDSTLEAILSFGPDGNLKQTNEAGCRLFNLSEDDIRSNNLKDNIRALLSRLVEPEQFLKVLKRVDQDSLASINENIETLDGTHFECYSAPTLLNDQYIGRVWSFSDVTDSKKHQEILQYQAHHDDLTGLPNRSMLIESIDHAIALANRNGTQVGVFFIDLDDFKKINDASGHLEGDRFLIHISRDIQKIIRRSDTFGRLGGDEFVLMMEGVQGQAEIKNTHERILNMFSRPFQTNAHKYFVTCSIGISSYPKDGDDAQDLIRKADMAMYQAKRLGKNTYQYFDEALASVSMRRVSLENELREALTKDEFVFHFQPKMDLTTGRILSVEALIRWQKPNGDLVYPDHFIPLAEDTGLIHSITRAAIRTACQKLNAWQGGILGDISMSVNISASDFSDNDFVENLLSEVNCHKLAPSKLELELTESLFLKDVDRVKRIIHRLKQKGLLLSIDDFGTGYSSFGLLQDLNVDYLKIDKSFVQKLFTNDKAKAIIKSIIDLGENLGIKIVAEGIETEQDHDFLKRYGCHIGQGYYYSRSVDEDKLIQFASDIQSGNVNP